MKWLIATCIALVIFAIPSAQAQLVNGGFETGDLTGWTADLPVGGTAIATTTHTSAIGSVSPVVPGVTSWGPSEGTYFGLLKPDGAGSISYLYQTFNASLGMTLTLDYFWDSQDYSPIDDAAMGFIVEGSGLGGAVVADLFIHSVTTDPGNYYGTPWTTVSHTFTSGGTYTLVIAISNYGDDELDSYVGVDAHSVGVMYVDVDIKPGSYPNSINLRNKKGVTPVGIYGSADFDVSTIDTATILLEGVAPVKCAIEDMAVLPNPAYNPLDPESPMFIGDGYPDLICHFNTPDLKGPLSAATEATLTCNNFGGDPISGTDSVNIIKE
jgi:hypothetical protein